jgi:polar amino acid transport system permease protein
VPPLLLGVLPEWAGPVIDYILTQGLPGTFRVAVVAVLGSAVIGMVLGTLLTLGFLPLTALIRLYIEVWRGLPIIVTIFMMYFVLPRMGLTLDPFEAASIGLALWGSAQVAEATRGAVQSIPYAQHEAAAALGFGWLGRHVYVILPQALRRLLPPLVSLLVNVTQNTTLASIIGVAEVLTAGQRQVERLTLEQGDPHAIEIYAGVMLVFFAISFPLTRLAAYLERRLA